VTEGPSPDDPVPFAPEPDAPEPTTHAPETDAPASESDRAPDPETNVPGTNAPAPASDPDAAAPGPDSPEHVTPAPDEPAGPPPDALAPGSDEAAAAPVTPVIPPPSVETTRRLLGASFDLLQRTSDDMRQASFYIGLVTLGTVGPFAIGSFAIEVVSIHRTRREMQDLLEGGLGGVSALLVIVATLGLMVAVVDSLGTILAANVTRTSPLG